MEDKEIQSKRIVRTITLTSDDLALLDDIERTMSRTGQRIKTDSKLIRAAIQIASKSLNNEQLDLVEIAEKVVREDGRTLSKLLEKEKKKTNSLKTLISHPIPQISKPFLNLQFVTHNLNYCEFGV